MDSRGRRGLVRPIALIEASGGLAQKLQRDQGRSDRGPGACAVSDGEAANRDPGHDQPSVSHGA